MSISTVSYKGLTLISSDGINPDASLFGAGGTLIQDNFISIADSIESFGPAGATIGQLNSLSGYNNSKFDTIVNSINISGFLYSRIDTISGYLQSQLAGGAVTLAQLNNVSGYSVVRIGAISGYSDTKFDTITNSANISGYLASKIISISGYSDTQFGTITNISNVSGYLAARTISVSGYSDAKFDTILNASNISGYLYGRISTVSGYSEAIFDKRTRVDSISGYNIVQYDTISNASSVSGYLYGRTATASGYADTIYSKRSYVDSVSGYFVNTNGIPTSTTASTAGSAVNTDAGLFNHMDITATASFTLNNPTNSVNTKKFLWRVYNNSGGSAITITMGSNFRFGGAISGIPTVINQKVQYIAAIYDTLASVTKWDVVSTDVF